MATILAEEGYRVETAKNGAEAVEALEHDKPQLVLLDMWMPVLDGWGVIREIHNRSIDVPVVVMTAGSDAEECARQVNAEGWLAKPFPIGALISTVARLVA